MLGSVVISANPILAWERFMLNIPGYLIGTFSKQDRDVGGYWSFSFDMPEDMVNLSLVDDFLNNGAMRHVEVFSVGAEKIWEGAIFTVKEDTGTAISELNLNDVWNSQWVRYNTGSGIDRGTVYNDLLSQAKVGVREKPHLAGEMELDVANQYVAKNMLWTSYPSPVLRSIKTGGRLLGRPKLSIKAMGYWHTLNARVYNQTVSSGTIGASDLVDDIITECGEFVARSIISTNVTPIEQKIDADRKAGDLIKSIAEFGDGGLNKWVCGFGNDLTFFFKQASRVRI